MHGVYSEEGKRINEHDFIIKERNPDGSLSVFPVDNFISVKHGITVESIVGGEISLYEKHKEFSAFKILHTGTRVTISIK